MQFSAAHHPPGKAAHGQPVAFYPDKHSVFRVARTEAKGDQGMTQFGRALAELNIEVLCANSSQAKGRVERVNRTLQDRLVKELRLAGIADCRGRSNFGAPGRRGSEVLRADLKPSQIKHKLRCGRGFSCGMPSASDRRSAPDFLRPLLQNYSALFRSRAIPDAPRRSNRPCPDNRACA